MKTDRNLSIANKYPSVATLESLGPNWRPWSLRAPFLLAFTALCLFLTIAIELLIRHCSPDGCHVLGSTSPEHISVASSFVYNYLPTAIGISFGLIWAVAQHDYMRMEPWFQLSRAEGATAEESLLAEYLYMFLPRVPIEAARRRHYTVLVSSVILLYTTLVLTPMTSGLLDEVLLTRHVEHGTAFSSLPWLGPEMTTADVNRRPSTDFAYLAYNHAWLNSSLPPFTMPKYALAPWVNNRGVPKQNESWTGSTMLYEADLECVETQRTPIVLEGLGIAGYNLTSANGTMYHELWDMGILEYTEIMNGKRRVGMNSWSLEFLWEGAWNSLATMLNNTIAQDTAIFMWGNSLDPRWRSTPGMSNLPKNWTAIFCSPKYYMEPVDAAVLMPSGEVKAIIRHPGPEQAAMRVQIKGSPRADNFFRTIIGTMYNSELDTEQYVDNSGKVIGFGYPPQVLPHIDSQLQRRFGRRTHMEPPVVVQDAMGGNSTYEHVRSSMSTISLYKYTRSLESFALYSQQNESLPNLLHPENLADMYQQAFKLLFSVFSANSQLDKFREEVSTTVSRGISVRGFQVNLTWSRGTQAGLGFIALLAVVLLVLGWGRRCNLDGEPHSLASGLGLLKRSPGVVKQLQHAEFYDLVIITRVLVGDGRRYFLRHRDGEGPWIEITKASVLRQLAPPTEEHQCNSREGWPMSTVSGIVFGMFFSIVLIFLVFIFSYNQIHDGRSTNFDISYHAFDANDGSPHLVPRVACFTHIVLPLHQMLTTTPGLPTIFTRNSPAYKVLFSYLPTILGLAVEPLLVTLGSYHYMLSPYKALHQGGSRSRRSLALDYDKSPPHFQIIRSLKAGDLTLAGLTLAILLSNVLASTFAGLFSAKGSDAILELRATSFGTPRNTGMFTVPAQEMYYRLSSSLLSELPAPSWTTPDYYILPVSFPSRGGFVSAEVSTLGLGSSISCSLVPVSLVMTACRDNNGEPCSSQPHGYHPQVKDPCWYQPYDIMAWGMLPISTIDRPRTCPNTFFVIWADWAEQPIDPSNLTTADTSAFENVGIRCTSAELVMQLTATVDSESNVLAIDDVVPLVSDRMDAFYPDHIRHNSTMRLMSTFLDVILAGGETQTDYPQNRLDWFNYLMVRLYPSLRDVGPTVTHIPAKSDIVQAFEDVYKRLYAVNLGLYASDMLGSVPGSAAPVTAIATAATERVAVNMVMFILAVVILCYIIVLLPFLYLSYAGSKITHKPTNLISMWAALYASNAQEDCGAVRGRNPRERAKRLREMEHQYCFQKFTGVDGTTHVGVIRERMLGTEEAELVSED